MMMHTILLCTQCHTKKVYYQCNKAEHVYSDTQKGLWPVIIKLNILIASLMLLFIIQKLENPCVYVAK